MVMLFAAEIGAMLWIIIATNELGRKRKRERSGNEKTTGKDKYTNNRAMTFLFSRPASFHHDIL